MSAARHASADWSRVPAVILSGGSEVIAAAVISALARRQIPLAIIALTKPSLVRDVVPGAIYREITWPPYSCGAGLDELISVLTEIGAGQPCPWPVFATEDGGLRLLAEGRARLAPYLGIPGGDRLRLGGLDKAELFLYLEQAGLAEIVAPTLVLEDPADAQRALARFGPETVFKPALKPFSMNLGPMGAADAKVISAVPGEAAAAVTARLARAWSLAERWIAQPRLASPSMGEAVWWGFRGSNGMAWGTLAFNRWKQPRLGGSGCWVEISADSSLDALAAQVLDAIDLRGQVEIEFMLDASERWRVLEVNNRPWLQVELIGRAGLPVVYATYLDMLNHEGLERPPGAQSMTWVGPERMLAAALSGEYGPRASALVHTVRVIARADCRAPYDTPLPRIKRRWLVGLVRKAWRRWVLRLIGWPG